MGLNEVMSNTRIRIGVCVRFTDVVTDVVTDQIWREMGGMAVVQYEYR
jgi:hypothetical protein